MLNVLLKNRIEQLSILALLSHQYFLLLEGALTTISDTTHREHKEIAASGI